MHTLCSANYSQNNVCIKLRNVCNRYMDKYQYTSELFHCSAKEKADVDNLKQTSVKEFFKDAGTYDAQLSKEQVADMAVLYSDRTALYLQRVS